MSNLSAPHFHNEEAAYAYVEARVWPNGPVCPHCGGVERISKMEGKSTRIGALQVLPVPQALHREDRHHLREPATFRCIIWLQAIYPDRRQQEGHQLATSFTAPLASPSKPLGSCRTASAKPCALATLRRSAATAASSRPTKPSSATSAGCRDVARRLPPQDEGSGAGRPRHRPQPRTMVDRHASNADTIMPILRANIAAKRTS